MPLPPPPPPTPHIMSLFHRVAFCYSIDGGRCRPRFPPWAPWSFIRQLSANDTTRAERPGVRFVSHWRQTTSNYLPSGLIYRIPRTRYLYSAYPDSRIRGGVRPPLPRISEVCTSGLRPPPPPPSPGILERYVGVDTRIRRGPQLWTIVAATLCEVFITFSRSNDFMGEKSQSKLIYLSIAAIGTGPPIRAFVANRAGYFWR